VLAPTTPYNDQTPLSTTADSALRLHLADLFYCGYSKLGRGLLKQTSGSCGASDLQASWYSINSITAVKGNQL